AVAQLGVPAPVVRTSPREWSPLVVGLETWLWVESWVSYSASASLGGVRATVTATPVSARFVTGDGGEVTCVGGGVPYDRSRSPEGQSSGCVHVYERRSTVSDPAGIYTLAVTVTYEVVWSASNGQGGHLEPLTRSASIPVQVVESQPVIR
ncbi:MAG: hypothetical protein N2037_09740, partial [Acidimicrobiales bacterium]|nr:hypothetical protein [Acidimicrobiales bacterium]